MTNKELVQKFKNGKIAVNCQTEEQATKFIKWCHENNMGWKYPNKTTTNYRCEGDKTTYAYNFFGDDVLGWADIEFYRNSGYEVITYTDFFKEQESGMIKKNYISQVAEMLGVEMYEKFKIKDFKAFFNITETGLEFYGQQTHSLDFILTGLLTGRFKIVKPILDDVEKRYFENVLRPIKNSVKCITKFESILDSEYISIAFYYPSEDDMCFPIFDKGTMYKGMEIDKDYTLEELGLFADE